MPPAREDRTAWLRLLKNDIPAFNEAIKAVDGKFRPDLRGVDLSGMDLRSAFIGRLDLTGANLRRAKVGAAGLTTCRIESVDLTDAAIEAAEEGSVSTLRLIQFLWKDVDAFNRGRQQLALLNNVDLSGAKLDRVDLSKLSLVGTVLTGADLSKANLKDTTVMKSNWRGVHFTGNELERTEFDDVDLTEGDFSNTHLQLVTMTNVMLHRTKFDDAKLEDVSLSKCTGEQSSFARALLKSTSITGSQLKGVTFRAAEMTDVELRYNGFVDGDFREVRTNDVVVADCDIAGSDFRGATEFEFKNEKNRDRARF